MGSQYARKLNISVLTSERESADRPNSAVMQLKGCRWGYVEETQKSEALNSQRLKEMVNPGEISGRDLNQKQENFEVEANLAVGQNYDFVIDTTDHGTWRRLKHYRSKVKFCANPDPANPYEKKDDQRFVREYVNDPACQAAWLGILVHYYERLQAEHGGEIKRVPCPTLDRETEAFRNGQDTLNRFITEQVVLSPALGREHQLSDVAARYHAWYEANIGRRHHVASETMQDLENSALQKHLHRTPNKTVVLRGCRLLTPDSQSLLAGEKYFGVGGGAAAAPPPPPAGAYAPPARDWWLPPLGGGGPPAGASPDKELPIRFADDGRLPEPGRAGPRPAPPPPPGTEKEPAVLADADLEALLAGESAEPSPADIVFGYV